MPERKAPTVTLREEAPLAGLTETQHGEESTGPDQFVWPAARWSNRFGDAQLDQLMQLALAGSPVLDVLDARMRAARSSSQDSPRMKWPALQDSPVSFARWLRACRRQQQRLLYDHRSIFHHANLAANVSDGNPATVHYLSALQTIGVTGRSDFATIDRLVTLQANTMALNDILWLFGIIFSLIVGIVWLAKPPFGAGSRVAA